MRAARSFVAPALFSALALGALAAGCASPVAADDALRAEEGATAQIFLCAGASPDGLCFEDRGAHLNPRTCTDRGGLRTPGNIVVEPWRDEDGDGWNDRCEDLLGQGFAPDMVFDEKENVPWMSPRYVVQPRPIMDCVDWAGEPVGGCVQIAYLMTYMFDGDHVRDYERVDAWLHFRSQEKTWKVDRVYFSAHDACTDDSDSHHWYAWGDPNMRWMGKRRGPFEVHVTENKHANHPNGGRCEDESCDGGKRYRLGTGGDYLRAPSVPWGIPGILGGTCRHYCTVTEEAVWRKDTCPLRTDAWPCQWNVPSELRRQPTLLPFDRSSSFVIANGELGWLPAQPMPEIPACSWAYP